MSISLGSINTGLPKDIVSQIMKAERIPVEKMQARKAKIAEKQKLVTDLEKLVSDLRTILGQNSTARNLRELKIDTNESIIGVTADKNIAETGQYQFEVVRMAQKSSAISSGFASKDDSYVGVGFIRYELPDGTDKSIYIDSDNASLSSVARLINENDDIGMRATVVNDGSGSDTPYRLILSLNDTGDEKKAKFPYFYFVDGDQDFYIDEEREAQDALVKLDGFEIEAPANELNDIIGGTTISLKRASPGEEFTIKISEDIEAIADKVSKIVDGINGIMSFIKTQNTMDETTDTSRTLGGDIMLQTLESRLRNVMFNPIQTYHGNFRAGDIGIRFTREGTLEFEKGVFNAKMSENYENVSQILIGRNLDGEIRNGLVQNLNEFTAGALMAPNGVIHSRKRGFRTNIEQIDRRIEQRERLLEKKETSLKDKFARLEATMARLRTQGAGVAALGPMPASPIQQLG